MQTDRLGSTNKSFPSPCKDSSEGNKIISGILDILFKFLFSRIQIQFSFLDLTKDILL